MLVTRVGRRPTKFREEVPWTPVTWYVFLVTLVMLLSFGARRMLAPESIKTFLVPFCTPRVAVATIPEEKSGPIPDLGPIWIGPDLGPGPSDKGAEVQLGE